jgi:Flp pilus assembly protein TadG
VALLMFALIGVTGLVVDVGHAYVVRSQLQNATNAAALAAAGYVYTSNSASVNTTSMVAQYSASTGGINTYSDLGTVNTVPVLKCLNLLMPKGSSCSTGSAPNAVQVTSTVKVPTFFMFLMGIRNLTVGATATASMQGKSMPWNVAIIVDSTGSMATVDSNCGSLTEFQCALSGTQALLEATPPCPSGEITCDPSGANVRMGLFTFPNVLTAVNGALPVVAWTNNTTFTADSIDDDTDCNGSPATYANPKRQPIAAPYTLPKPGAVLPVDPNTGLTYLTYTQTSTGTTWNATYQITPFLSDYFQPSSSSGLNSSSKLVQAVGYGTTKGCLTYTLGIDGSDGTGSHFGNTYFASSIYAAQSALNAEQAAYGGRNALIFLSDGQSNASYYSKNSSTYGSTVQATHATEFPEAPAGSEVGPSTTSYPVPAYLTPATILPAQATLGYDTLSTTSTATGQTRSGSTKGTYPDWYDQCQQAIVAAQYAAAQGTTVFSVAYGSESSGCTNGWSTGATDTTLVATGINQPFPILSSLLPCTTMENIASSWSTFYSDNQQTGNVNLGCTDLNHTTVSLDDIFQAIAVTFTTPRLLPNNAS